MKLYIEEELPKKGQIVWVRDNDGQRWVITHFLKKEDGKYFCSGKNDSDFQLSWKHLTTKNPYEEEDREPKVGDMVFAWSNEGEPPTYGELIRFSNTESCINPLSSHLETFKHCSLKNPLVK